MLLYALNGPRALLSELFCTVNQIDRDMTSGTVRIRAPLQICLDEGVLLMNLLLLANQHLHAHASSRIPDAYSHHPIFMAIQCHQMYLAYCS